MELLQSEKFKLPTLYFITDREEIKELPLGVPFIFGDKKSKAYIIRILEYELLYERAMKSGLPFNFRQILLDEGYKGLGDCAYHHPVFIDYATEGLIEGEDEWLESEHDSIQEGTEIFDEFIRDSAVYVDIKKIKDLNVFPMWLDNIEEAVETNIHNFAVYNPNMYNKKLEGMYGAIDLVAPNRNLVIIDISGSIPKGVSSTCLALAKSLAETFYADILITGSESILYDYSEIHTLNIETIYEMGMNNDQAYFKALLSGDKKCYKTAIVFGDNDHPGHSWQGVTYISDEDGKKLCTWEIDKLISFHTSSTKELAGYARWFNVPESNIERIDNWVKYL